MELHPSCQTTSTNLLVDDSSQGSYGLSDRIGDGRRAVVQCGGDTCKAETRTILEPPNRAIRNCVSAFENLGPNGTLLWKVLGRRAGQSSKNTAHSSARRLPYEIHGAPASTRAPRARVHQFTAVVPPEYGSCCYVSPAGRLVDQLASCSQASSGQARYDLRLAGRTQRLAPAASWRQVAR